MHPAGKAVIRLEGIRLQAGRLPRCWPGGAPPRTRPRILRPDDGSEAIDRIRGAEVASAYPDALGRIVVARRGYCSTSPSRRLMHFNHCCGGSPLSGARGRGPDTGRGRCGSDARDAAALAAMTEAISLAQRVGMIRPFLTAGPQVAGLLGRHRHVVARHLEFTGQLDRCHRRRPVSLIGSPDRSWNHSPGVNRRVGLPTDDAQVRRNPRNCSSASTRSRLTNGRSTESSASATGGKRLIRREPSTCWKDPTAVGPGPRMP